MFSLLSRKNQDQVQRFMFRFINQRSMAKIKMIEHARVEERIDLNVGVWGIPVVDRQPDIQLAFRGLTKNFTSSGVGLFVDHDLTHETILLRLVAESQSIFLQTELVDCTPLGAGYFLAGLAVQELVHAEKQPPLQQFEQLLQEVQPGRA